MRMDVVGLSLAETALVLLFAVFAILLGGKVAEKRRAEGEISQRNQIFTLKRDLDTERQNNAALSHQMAILLPKLRSTAFPSCAETGKSSGWLFTATVRGKDIYEVEGARRTLTELLNVYAAQLQEADRAECRQRIGCTLALRHLVQIMNTLCVKLANFFTSDTWAQDKCSNGSPNFSAAPQLSPMAATRSRKD